MGLEIVTYISTQTESETDYIEKMVQVYQSLQVDRYVSDTNFCQETHVTYLNFIMFKYEPHISWMEIVERYAELKE